MKSLKTSTHSVNSRASLPRPSAARRPAVLCRAQAEEKEAWRKFAGAAAASLVAIGMFLEEGPALADLNRFEYNAATEFGEGSAQQFGEADVQGRDFSNQDLRRANFTAADARRADFHNSNLQGAYFIKSVVFQANFENANLSDVLMDRAILNEANLKNAILARSVLTRSDLGKANIYGADFTNALIDKEQQMNLCKYADGENTVTGVSTRASLGCGSKRRRLESSPSNPEGPQVTTEEKDAFIKTLPKYYVTE